jgi:DNA-binding HxlR family transcriptional regulator
VFVAETPAHPGAHDPEALTAFCPVFHEAVELIGRRWSGAIVRVLLSGETRFSDVAASIPGISDRLLSERLKELEAAGVVERHVIPETPVRIEYILTEKGQDLADVFHAIGEWADTWAKPAKPARQRRSA